MGRSRRRFTKEFKVEAVRLLTEGECSVAQVARDLGIRDTISAAPPFRSRLSDSNRV